MQETPNRIIAIDPITKGFGYAIFDKPFHLVAWGIARVEGEKHTGAVTQFTKLLADFRPDEVVLEDAVAPGSRRRHRVQRLIETLVALAREHNLTVHAVPRRSVVERFSSEGKPATKYSIAQRLTVHFPELGDKLPRPRKPWQSEDERMLIFDALALAVTHVTE